MKTTNCVVCGKKVQYFPSRPRKYCGKTCFQTINKKRLSALSIENRMSSDEGRRNYLRAKKRFGGVHPVHSFSTGKAHWNWNGGIKITGEGYRLIKKPDHPNAYCNGYVPEHVYVMSQHLGRPLKKGEHVHHKDHNRANNQLENLTLFGSAKEHTSHHWKTGKRHKKRVY